MKRNLAVTSTLIALVAMFFLGTAATAQQNSNRHCSDATNKGKYGFSSNGTLINVGPVVATGIGTFDGKGSVSGKQTRSLNGDVADETFTGTYTVNHDCTGTEVVQVYQNGQLMRTTTLSFVVAGNGDNAQGIFTKVELPDHTILPAVITVEAMRLFPKD